jgi:hypothetical protein
MRDLDAIDTDLRVLAVYRQACAADGRRASLRLVDRLLDERLELHNLGGGTQRAAIVM